MQITQPLQNFPLNYGRPGYVLAAGGKDDRLQSCVSRVVSPHTAGTGGERDTEYGTVTIEVP